MLRKSITAAALALSVSPSATYANDPFIGTVQTFAFNFCPRGWLPADGRLISISENTTLFSLLGTFYGGDGRTTFALPDLRGRAAIGQGTAAGGLNYDIGRVVPGHGASASASVPGHVAVTTCVAINGIYPSRS